MSLIDCGIMHCPQAKALKHVLQCQRGDKWRQGRHMQRNTHTIILCKHASPPNTVPKKAEQEQGEGRLGATL